MLISRSLTLLTAIVFLSGCAIGPIMSHDVGRTVGDGNHDIRVLTSIEGFYGLKYDYGLTKDLDLGFQYEAASLGLKLKYAFINNQKSGWSLGSSLGTGTSFGGSYYNVAVLSSFKGKLFEPFMSVRYTKVENDPTELTDTETGDFFLSIPAFDYDYTQAFLGTKIWMVDWFALSLEAGSFIGSGDVEFSDNVFYSVGVDFYF